MPIDYSKYPPNWLSEIRPRIMKRANNTCEFEGCDFKHLEYVWSVKYRGKVMGWFRDFKIADKQPKSGESKLNKKSGFVESVLNQKQVRVVLTIAHLDHDEENKNVKDDRLMAMCQIHHLRYDAKEKDRRQLEKANKNQIKLWK